MVAVLAAYIRIMLVAPVVAVERVYNPVAALKRSWMLTQGNTGRLALFLGLIVLVALVALGALVGILGSLVTVMGQDHLGSHHRRAGCRDDGLSLRRARHDPPPIGRAERDGPVRHV